MAEVCGPQASGSAMVGDGPGRRGRGTLWTESPVEPDPLSSGKPGRAVAGLAAWWAGRGCPAVSLEPGGRSECLLSACGLVPPRLPSREPWTEAFPSSPHVLSCSSSWFWLQLSCALGVPFLPGPSAFSLLFSSVSAPETAPGVSAPSAPACAVRPGLDPWVCLPALRSPAIPTACDSLSRKCFVVTP